MLSQLISVFYFSVGHGKYNTALRISAKYKNLGHKICNLPWRKIHNSKHLLTYELLRGIKIGYLRRGFCMPVSSPKSISSLYAGFFAFLKTSAPIIVPALISRDKKLLKSATKTTLSAFLYNIA